MTGTHGLGRKRIQALGGLFAQSEALVPAKEKSLILAVIDLRNHHGSASRETEFILLVDVPARFDKWRLSSPIGITARSRRVDKKWNGIQFFIAKQFIGTAVQLIGTGFERKARNPLACPSEFRGRKKRNHFEFPDGILRKWDIAKVPGPFTGAAYQGSVKLKFVTGALAAVDCRIQHPW